MTTDRESFSLRKVFRSFRYAFAGIADFVRRERNFKVHLVATACVVIAAAAFRVTALEWVALLLCIGMVLSAEIFNSAVEALCDKVSPGIDPLVKRAKDMGAAAVLVLAFVSVIVGLIIFIPYIIGLFNS